VIDEENRRVERERELSVEKTIEEQTRVLDTRDQRAVASHNAASALPYVKATRAGNLNKGTYSEQDIKDIVQLHENSRKLLSKKSELTRDQKSVVQAALTKDVSCKAAQQITGVGARRVRQIKQDAEIMFNTDGPSITEDEDNLKSDNAHREYVRRVHGLNHWGVEWSEKRHSHAGDAQAHSDGSPVW
jgi:hypothetical protein